MYGWWALWHVELPDEYRGYVYIRTSHKHKRKINLFYISVEIFPFLTRKPLGSSTFNVGVGFV